LISDGENGGGNNGREGEEKKIMGTPFELERNPVHDVTTPLKPVRTDWWVTFEKDNPQPPHAEHLMNFYYNKVWKRTQEYLQDLAEEDHYEPLARLKEPPVPALPERELDSIKALGICAWRYIRYMQIYKKLERLNDQHVHPQKMELIRNLVESVLGRTLELKHEMVGIDLLDPQFLDDLFQTFKINPEQMEPQIPKFYLYEQRKQMEQKAEILQRLLETAPSKDTVLAEWLADDERFAAEDAQRAEEQAAREKEMQDDPEAAAAEADTAVAEEGGGEEGEAAEDAHKEETDAKPRMPKPKKMTLKEALLILKRMERARQGRLKFKKQWQTVIQNRVDKMKLARGDLLAKMNEAARKIQSCWRCFLARREKARRLHEEQLFLGMAEPKDFEEKLEKEKSKLRDAERKRRALQRQKAYEFTHAPDDIKARLKEEEIQRRREQMVDDIRQWFRDCYQVLNNFPTYPTAKIGGSNRIYDEMTPEELLRKREEAKKLTKEQKKQIKQEEREKKKEERKEKRATMRKFKKELKKWLKLPGWYMKDSKWSDSIEASNGEYLKVWQDKMENYNPTQGCDRPMIEAQKREEIDEELRTDVDAIMKMELEELKFAIRRKRGRVPRERKPKEKKKKAGKDMTKDRTLESLFEELVVQGIAKPPEKIYFSQMLGSFNVLGSYTRASHLEAQPTMWNVKNILKDYVMLPLGCEEVHKRSPVVKSILICGPDGAGKRSLVHAMANEMKANIFDVSAQNLIGKYPGSELKMLIHLLIKVGNLMGPTIIFIDEAERMFLKPKLKKKLAIPGDESQPARIKGQLQKAIKKQIKGGIRVVVIGITSTPFNATPKGLNKFYQKIIYLPRPDYGARLTLWKWILPQYLPSPPFDFNYAALAKMTDGYTAGDMHKVMQVYLGMDPTEGDQKPSKFTPSRFPTNLLLDLTKIFVKFPFVNLPLDLQFEKYMTTTASGKKRKKKLAKEAAQREADKLAAEKEAAKKKK